MKGNFTQDEELKTNILHLFVNHSEPVGAGWICERLEDSGFVISEASVSRLLRQFDKKKITLRIGYQGRVITAYGEEYLKELENRKQHNTYGQELINTVESITSTELLDLLVVRKALERESVRLAVMSATKEELERLERLIYDSNISLDNAASTTKMDLAFHDMIAEMSQNKVLKSTLKLLLQNKDIHTITGSIRRKVGTALLTGHIRILDAMKNGNVEYAVKAMEHHIDTVIDDVNKYLLLNKENVTLCEEAES